MFVRSWQRKGGGRGSPARGRLFCMAMRAGLVASGLCLASPRVPAALDPASLSEVSLNLGGIAYWSHPVFANGLWNTGSPWLEYAEGQWGSNVALWNNPQFDANGFPKYLNAGFKLRAMIFALHAENEGRPASWPSRIALAKGKVVVTWRGDADIRANGGTYLGAESSGASSGRLVNGRRVYRFTGGSSLQWITVEEVNAANPVTDIKVWMPDPADPDNRALEGALFHPTYLARLADARWGTLRFMDWNDTNSGPQQDWVDRRLPAYAFQGGVLNPRAPATGFGGNRGTGVAFEHMVALCNATGRDMWICIPHLATDDFVTRLAQLIRYGSDGVQPYSSAQASPVHAPLDAGRRVFVEFSNEIWSNGDSFSQGNWAQAQGAALGLSKERFNARRFCEVWRLFHNVFGDGDRLVRVAAVWTGSQSYTTGFLNEIAAYGPTLSPAQAPDLVAPTTYFGNGIQDWAYTTARRQAGTSDPWFYTAQTYTNGSGTVKPVSIPSTDPYWAGATVQQHIDQAFAEWKRRLMSGSTQTGGGPDANGIGGGFDPWLRDAIVAAFGVRKPIYSYEGGPSIYTDGYDSGDSRDGGLTIFMELLNRQAEVRDVYRTHLNMAKAKGLRGHNAFVDIGRWGRYGQWGHLEYLGQEPRAAAKWAALIDWFGEMAGLRPVDEPLGAVPSFVTAIKLPVAVYQQPYSADIVVSGGDGAPRLEVIDSLLSAGLSVAAVPGDAYRLRVSGTPTAAGEDYVYVRAADADGDPAWRTFAFRTVGGPGVVLESKLEGTNPAQNLPWTATYALRSNVAFTGWTRGAGISAASGNDALVWSQAMPSSEASATLALAITDSEYWTLTLTPAAGFPLNLRRGEVRFNLQRIDYHAPRRYAVFTSVGGFADGAQVYDTGRFDSLSNTEFIFQLPDLPAYDNLTGAVSFRLYGYAGQYAAHRTSLCAFKLTQASSPSANLAPAFAADPLDKPAAVTDLPYAATLAGDASDPNAGDALTFSKLGGPAWLTVAASGALSGTPAAANLGTNLFLVRVADAAGLFDDATARIVVRQPAAAPVASPAGGSFGGPVTVCLVTDTPGAAIRYTLDGSTPTGTSGTLYTAPFAVAAGAALRAVAGGGAFGDSAVAEWTFAITTGSGAFQQTGAGDIVMEVESFTDRTRNGDTMDWTAATAPAGYSGAGLMQAAQIGAGFGSWSAGARLAYAVNFVTTGSYYVWIRRHSPDYDGNSAFVGLDGVQAGSTFDNETASFNTWYWKRHASTLSVGTAGAHTFEIRRREDGYSLDKIVLTRSSTYTPSGSGPAETARGVVAAPAFLPVPGVYGGPVAVTLACGTDGASLRYTTDGAVPTAASGVAYTGTFTLVSSALVRAVAYKAGQGDSIVTAGDYTVVASGHAEFAAAAATVGEAAGTVLLTVRRTGGSAAGSVAYATGDGTAAAGADYAAATGTLHWAAGDTADKAIPVAVADDAVFFEGDETFVVTLSAPAGVVLGSPSACTVTIRDNDNNTPPRITLERPMSSPVAVPAGAGLLLRAVVSDDGYPGPTSVGWSRVSGPGVVAFTAPAERETGARFSAAGVYILRIRAADGSAVTTLDVEVHSGDGLAANPGPDVSAGPAPAAAYAGRAFALHGVVSDDGLPNPPGAVTLRWDGVGGPAAVVVGNPAAADTTVTCPAAGRYTLRLCADDGAVQTFADVDVDVQPAAGYGWWADGITWGGADRAAGADADGDGAPNLLEFFHNTPPLSAGSAAARLRAFAEAPAGQTQLVLTYRKNRNLGGVVHWIQTSATLLAWSNIVAFVEEPVPAESDAETEVVRVRLPLGGETHRFYRLLIRAD